jgi:glycosyltransferase involved in cell wall biosynthesis
VVNTADRAGGADRVARDVLNGFPELGTETSLAVAEKHTDDPRVIPFDRSPHVDYRPYTSTRSRFLLEARRTIHRAVGLEDFNHPYSHHLLELTGSSPDLVFCNNLHGEYFDLRVLPGLSRRLPVVLRLADNWTFTGHCATPLGCTRWETGCGSCPDLTIPPLVERDATAFNWRRKRRILSRARLFVVTPSHWLLERARRSLLAPAIDAAAVVPNGIDLDTFRPEGPVEDRRALGIDPDAKLLLFVCNRGITNPAKDFPTLRAALELLSREGRDEQLELLVVGRRAPRERLGERVRIQHLPYIASPRDLAALYRAADLYVHSSPEEGFCGTAAEALACGTPVVAAAGGGTAEVVEHGRTGVVTPPGRPDELAAGIGSLILDDRLRARMAEAAADSAHRRFDRRRMVAALHAWCVEAHRNFAPDPA